MENSHSIIKQKMSKKIGLFFVGRARLESAKKRIGHGLTKKKGEGENTEKIPINTGVGNSVGFFTARPCRGSCSDCGRASASRKH